jgi:hypothetical protein
MKSLNNEDSNKVRLKSGQRWIFFATFVNYAMSHWTRKSYTNVKVNYLYLYLYQSIHLTIHLSTFYIS